MYNKAYAELQLGRREQCLEMLENGQEVASGTSESRHRIITNALDNLRVSEGRGRGEREWVRVSEGIREGEREGEWRGEVKGEEKEKGVGE